MQKIETKWYKYSKEVKHALEEMKPVVALESTIISHGMPYPKNLETAKEVEKIVRDHGAQPATIGVIRGQIKIGLNDDELEHLATDKDVVKASVRDFPYVVSMKKSASTTVAGTLFCTKLASIPVFVTGGIGGVHKDYSTSLDLSADLIQISQTNTMVVSSGIKSILDIPKTMEYLETIGVPILGYKTKDFPAFFTRESGEKVNHVMDTPEDVARYAMLKWDMNLAGGILIANPVPHEFSLKREFIDQAIEEAVKEATDKGIKGKDVTPFILSHINHLTKGESLKANVALIKNNALVGAQIAYSLSKLV